VIKCADRGNFLSTVADLLPLNSVCIELGVHKGIQSHRILNRLNPQTLFLVDPFVEGADRNGESPHYKGGHCDGLKTAYSNDRDFSLIQKKFSDEIKTKKIVVRQQFSYEAVDSFPDNYFDFIYIDACHLYGSVIADLIAYLPKLKETGLMCGHDYINQSNYGVIKAVDEFVDTHDFEWVALSNVADWALKKRNRAAYKKGVNK